MDPDSESLTANAADYIAKGQVALGIELGSTRIKACAVLPDGTSVVTGVHEWQNTLVDGHWSYSLEDVWAGFQDCFKDLTLNSEKEFGVRPSGFSSIGISAMMHGYLAFGKDGNQLVPFRTWRDTYTGEAAERLTQTLGANIPHR